MILKTGAGGARIRGVKAETVVAMVVCDSIHKAVMDGVDMVVTECTGGTHHPGSLHYNGLAIDIRTRDMTDAQKADFYQRCKAALGDDFDVVDEGDPSHAHVEHQPKEP